MVILCVLTLSNKSAWLFARWLISSSIVEKSTCPQGLQPTCTKTMSCRIFQETCASKSENNLQGNCEGKMWHFKALHDDFLSKSAHRLSAHAYGVIQNKTYTHKTFENCPAKLLPKPVFTLLFAEHTYRCAFIFQYHNRSAASRDSADDIASYRRS